MAIVKKKATVTTTNNTNNEVKKNTTTTNASTTPVVKKKATVTTKENTNVKTKNVKETKKETNKANGEVKKLKLTGNTKQFIIKEGSQATQEAFLNKFYKKLQNLGYDITKQQAKSLKVAYSETLKEITDIASYYDVDADIKYSRKYIKLRVTEPPKAKDGLKTLMLGHYELKVRKTLGDVDEYKFFGNVSEDGNTFITVNGEEIPINEEDTDPNKKVKVRKFNFNKNTAVEEETEVVEEENDSENIDVEETEVVEEENDSENIDVEEENDVDEDVDDNEFDDFLPDEEDE